MPILTWIAQQFRDLLAEIGRPASEVLGIGLCLPAPVDHAAGRVMGPSVMTGWDDFDIPGWFASAMPRRSWPRTTSGCAP